MNFFLPLPLPTLLNSKINKWTCKYGSRFLLILFPTQGLNATSQFRYSEIFKTKLATCTCFCVLVCLPVVLDFVFANFDILSFYLRVHSNWYFYTSAIFWAFGGAPSFLAECCPVKLLPAVTLSTFVCPVSNLFFPFTHDTTFTFQNPNLVIEECLFLFKNCLLYYSICSFFASTSHIVV